MLPSMVRTNTVVRDMTLVTTSWPDTVELCRSRISGTNYAENVVSNAAGIRGGWAVASVGAEIGTAICSGIGIVIG